MEVKTNVIKRNGKEVSFDISKIENAIRKANQNVERIHQMNDYQIRAVADNIAQQVGEFTPACAGLTAVFPFSAIYRNYSGRREN